VAVPLGASLMANLTFSVCYRAGFIRTPIPPACSQGVGATPPVDFGNLPGGVKPSPLPPEGVREPALDTWLICGRGLAPCE
jgi:hypothetical protein